MCLRLYRHYTACGCLLATNASLRECRHGPTSPLCGPHHTIGIVTRKGEECGYHARLTRKQRHAPGRSRTPRFRKPSGPGVTDMEIAAARIAHLRSLDAQERLDRFRAKGLKGSYCGDPQPKPRGGAVVFSRTFDGTEYMGHHPEMNTDLEEAEVAQQKTRCRLRDAFLTLIQKEGLFDPSDRFLSSAWDDDDGLSDESSEADPNAMETTSYSEGAGPMTSSEVTAADDGAMDDDEADEQEDVNDQSEDDHSDSVQDEGSSQREDSYPPTGVEWTSKLKYLTGFRSSQPSA